jgi:hypothetical protein
VKGKAPFVRELLDRVEGPVQGNPQSAAGSGQNVVVFRIVEAEPPAHAHRAPLALPQGKGRVNAWPVGPG